MKTALVFLSLIFSLNVGATESTPEDRGHLDPSRSEDNYLDPVGEDSSGDDSSDAVSEDRDPHLDDGSGYSDVPDDGHDF